MEDEEKDFTGRGLCSFVVFEGEGRESPSRYLSGGECLSSPTFTSTRPRFKGGGEGETHERREAREELRAREARGPQGLIT